MNVKCLKERNYGGAYIPTNKPINSGGLGGWMENKIWGKNGTLTSQLANFQLLFDIFKKSTKRFSVGPGNLFLRCVCVWACVC